MKYKILRITGALLFVLGVSIVIFQLMTKEKSIFGSLASGGSPIAMGAGLIGVSIRLERKKTLLSIGPKRQKVKAKG